MAAEKPLIVIIGPTASGKTSLAIEIAQQFDGEIISADSRAIYRGMNIGTAKPTADEQSKAQHWGIDIVDPDERFTVYDFKKYTTEKVSDIRRRGKLPIMAGGSGLYIDSVVYDYQMNDDKNTINNRENLDKKSVADLIKHCEDNNITLPENYKNKRYLIRAIEKNGRISDDRKRIIPNTVIVGISTTKDELTDRIAQRAEEMFAGDIVEETESLSAQYSLGLESMKSNIYPIVKKMIDDEINLETAKVLSKTNDWQLAKKQMTWFRRNPSIKWLPLEEAKEYLESMLK